MRELIVLAVLAVAVIAALVTVIVALLRAQAAERADWRIERSRLTLQIMSSNATEFAIAQAREHIEERPVYDRNPQDHPVGL